MPIFNGLEFTDAPEIIVEKMWVHAGLGTLTELVCHIDAVPTAQVTISIVNIHWEIALRKSIMFFEPSLANADYWIWFVIKILRRLMKSGQSVRNNQIFNYKGIQQLGRQFRSYIVKSSLFWGFTYHFLLFGLLFHQMFSFQLQWFP